MSKDNELPLWITYWFKNFTQFDVRLYVERLKSNFKDYYIIQHWSLERLKVEVELEEGVYMSDDLIKEIAIKGLIGIELEDFKFDNKKNRYTWYLRGEI